MYKEVIFLPDASLEFEEAFHWHERQRRGLGFEFFLCVEAEIEIIKRNPKLFPIGYKDLRKSLVKRFPYEIFYKVISYKVYIFAVFHAKRDRKIIKKRNKNF